VRRVRRVRGGVWPRGFRGKFLTDCEYLSNSDQVTGRNPTLRKGIKGRTKRCSEQSLFYIFSILFVHTRLVASIRSQKKI